MALKIGDNFSYQGKKPNFDRDSFDTLASMKAFPETSIDEGHISYCKENGKNYQYKAANSVDPTTGKWREFKSGDSYPAGGTDGQVLTKTSSGVAWKNIPEGEPELPSGGSNGQVLTKTASGTAWQDVPKELPTEGTVGQVLKKTSTGVEWGTDNDTKYTPATTTENGLLSKEDKAKLNSIIAMSVLTQAEYDELETKDANTIYVIKG